MLAPRNFLACCLIILHHAVDLSLASPLLSERENSYHLKCTNARSVVAGNFLDPKDATAPITNTPATCQAEYKYLHCTPGTTTYIFFGTIPSSPKPDYATTLQSVTDFVAQHVHNDTDSDDSGGPLPNGARYFLTSGSPVQIYAQDAPPHNLTYAVLAAALRGLHAWMAAPVNAYSDATFQINDGADWVGSGYVGSVDAEGECVFQGARHPNLTCAATDESGYIYGEDGGRFCGG